jgi:hypothetical protein
MKSQRPKAYSKFVMVRANEKSEVKSMRVKGARKRVLKAARESGRKLTSIGPPFTSS